MSEKKVLSVEMADSGNDSDPDSSKESTKKSSTDETVSISTETEVSTPVMMETEVYTLPASNLHIPIQKPVFSYKIDGRKIKLTCGIETEYVSQNNMAEALERQCSAYDELFKPSFFNISEVITCQQNEKEMSHKRSDAIEKIFMPSEVVNKEAEKSVTLQTDQTSSTISSTLTKHTSHDNDRPIHADDYQNPFQNKATINEQSLKNAISHYKTSSVDISTEQSNSSETNKSPKTPSVPLIEYSTINHLYPERSDSEKQHEDITLQLSVLKGKWCVEGDTAPFPNELPHYNKPMNSSSARLKDLYMNPYPIGSENFGNNTRGKLNKVTSHPDYISQKPDTTMYISVKDKNGNVCTDSKSENDDTGDDFYNTNNTCSRQSSHSNTNSDANVNSRTGFSDEDKLDNSLENNDSDSEM